MCHYRFCDLCLYAVQWIAVCAPNTRTANTNAKSGVLHLPPPQFYAFIATNPVHTPPNVCVCDICDVCSRELGHKVKTISASEFTEAEVEAIKNGGNDVARRVWLAKWTPQDYAQPDPSQPPRVREFMRLKYMEKRWYRDPNEKPPVKKKKSISKPAAEETAPAEAKAAKKSSKPKVRYPSLSIIRELKIIRIQMNAFPLLLFVCVIYAGNCAQSEWTTDERIDRLTESQNPKRVYFCIDIRRVFRCGDFEWSETRVESESSSNS